MTTRRWRPWLAFVASAVIATGCGGAATSIPSTGPIMPSPMPSAAQPSRSPVPTASPTARPSPAPTPTAGPPAVRVGEPAWVAVAVATGWRRPDAPRPVDAPALADPVRIREWLAALNLADQRGLIGLADTQVLLGDRVDVTAIEGDWAQVVLPDQATPLDVRGYPAWIPLAQLTATAPGDVRTWATVIAPTAWLEDAEGRRVVEVSFGTRLALVSTGGGFAEVAAVGGRRLRVAAAVAALSAGDEPPLPTTAEAVIATARGFLGTRYLWAGTSGFGFDCSGLVHAVYRVHGVLLPRDSADQATAGVSVARAELEPGDLAFFAGGGRVHHVAIFVGGGRVIEAPAVGESVREVRLSEKAGYAGARRVLP